MRRALIFGLAIAFVMALHSRSFAVSEYRTDFNNMYGTAGTALDTCTLCHPSIPALNSYGIAYADNGFDFAAIEGLDSDGDGASNITEINARTFPGDPSSTPPVEPPPSGGMPLPPGGVGFPAYAAIAAPVLSDDPATAKPVAAASVVTSQNLSDIVVGFGQFAGAVDVYFGVYGQEVNPNDIYLVTSTGGIVLISEGLVPWKVNTMGNFSEAPFANLPTGALPPGYYVVYVAVAPTGVVDRLYVWATYYTIAGGDGAIPTEITALWTNSGHADATAEAFNHWNEDGSIPTSCARCHSEPGYLDYLGADGTAPGIVDNAAPIGTVVTCDVCHDAAATALTSVTFPSGDVITSLGGEARCMVCHQGRSSTVQVDEAVAEAALPTEDTVGTGDSALRFINIHYFAAAATLYGAQVRGGYQYAGKAYDVKFAHVDGYDTCIQCHDPHSLQVKVASCSQCHTGVSTVADLKNVRMNGSLVDYDGDGNLAEGIYWEVAGMREKLYAVMRAYGAEVAGTPIAYDAASYPYFFADDNNNGSVDEGEQGYSAWTSRLLKAAYNYHTSIKDPGAFAHNAKYVIEFLYDSAEDLNKALSTPVDLTGTHRTDEGHFNGSAEAFRHWDEDGVVSASCAKCHGKDGLAILLNYGINITAPVSNGMMCINCHDSHTAFTRWAAGPVEFPSGLTASMGGDSNLCMNCHQGRASKSTVDDAIAASEGPYTFINIHYFAAAASLFGADVEGGYEYPAKTYAGQNLFPAAHSGSFDTCVGCHMAQSHNVDPARASCSGCHTQLADVPFTSFRPPSTLDYDGDGNTSESRRDEIAGLETALFTEMQTYAAEVIDVPIVYNPASHPYFFEDTNGNGLLDAGETTRYESFDAKLLKAAYNYQVSLKEPCGYIHNAQYIAQLLVDSIGDLGGNVSAYTWR